MSLVHTCEHIIMHTCEQRVHLNEVYAAVAVAVILVEEGLEDPAQARLVLAKYDRCVRACVSE